MDRNMMSQRRSIGFRSGEHGGQSVVTLQELPAYSRHMRLGIVVHQEEPRTHCTSVGSDNGSKDFIPIPNGSQGAVV